MLLNLSRDVATRVDPTLYTAVFFVSVLIITKYIDRMPYDDMRTSRCTSPLPAQSARRGFARSGAALPLGVSRPRHIEQRASE